MEGEVLSQILEALFDRFYFRFGIGLFCPLYFYNLWFGILNKTFIAKFFLNGRKKPLDVVDVLLPDPLAGRKRQFLQQTGSSRRRSEPRQSWRRE